LAPIKLDDDVARYALPREVTAQRKRKRDHQVQMGAGDRAHEQDDPHDHEPGRNHSRRQADLTLAMQDASPAATSTSMNVPSNSEKSRRHCKRSSSN
jgi:hypothetical protein